MGKHGKILGLDIGHHTVKAVVAERRGQSFTILRTELLPFIGSADEKVNMLKGWLIKTGLQSIPCVLGISGQSARFQPIILPPADQRSLGQAVAMEVSRFNELAQEDSVYSFTPLSNGLDGGRRLLLAMARSAVMDELMALPRLCGLHVVDIVPLPVALLNTVGASGSIDRAPCLCIDIGDAATEIAISSPAGLMFARSFAVGGRMFTESIARAAADMTLAQAESVKITKGDIHGNDVIAQALRQTAGIWITELQSCLAVYRSAFHAENEQPNLIILAGGGSELKHLAEFLSEKTGLEVSRVSALPVDAPKEHSARFVNAKGLAMAGLGLGTVSLSVLPRSIREELELRRKKPYWIAAGCTAACILAVSLAGGYRDFLRKEQQLRIQRESLQRCTALANELQNVNAANRQITTMLAPVGGLLWNGWAMEKMLAVVAKAKGPNDFITMVADADSYFSPPASSAPTTTPRNRTPRPTAAAGTNTTAFTRLIVEGYTTKGDFSTVKLFIAELGKAPFVESADLLSDDQLVGGSDEERPGGAKSKRFVIDVRVKPPQGDAP